MNVVVNGPRTAVATLKTVAVGVIVMGGYVVLHDKSSLVFKLTRNFQVHSMYALNSMYDEIPKLERIIHAVEIFYLKGLPREMQFHAATSQSFPHCTQCAPLPTTNTQYPVAQHLGTSRQATKETLVQLTVSTSPRNRNKLRFMFPV